MSSSFSHVITLHSLQLICSIDTRMLLRILILSLHCLFIAVTAFDFHNDRPIIGIVTEETNSTLVPNANSFMLASNVKFLESAGARVVPIWIYRSEDYYEDILSKVNGVLFPGGADLWNSDGFGRAGKIIFDIATELNDNGDFFPLWGTCLGFELLNYVAVNENWMTYCDAQDMASSVKLVKGYEKSRMFKGLDSSIANKLESQPVVYSNHHWCITPKNFNVSGLSKYFKVLALDQDAKNLTYISIVEAHKYPFYAVTFHPEKVVFEFEIVESRKNVPHNSDAVHFSQYFANFFVDEARKSGHHFSSKEEEDAALIYNYEPLFTGKYENNPNEQTYYFSQEH